MDCSTPGFPVLHHLQKLAQTHIHWVGDAIQRSHPLSPLLLLPSIFPSIRVFSSESVLHIRWPKYWSFSFSIRPSNVCSGLTSFRIDWLDLLAIQGTLKSLLQHHSSKASILWHSAFFQRKQWQPTPVLLPGKSHGQRNLAGYSPGGCKESDTTEATNTHTKCTQLCFQIDPNSFYFFKNIK